jgi:heat shock transcription factor, other eukaryote
VQAGENPERMNALTQNPDYAHIIAWDVSKRHIDILDPSKMQTEITPLFFRHSKFESFVRQLNLYGFKKIKNQGRLRFTHALLIEGQP